MRPRDLAKARAHRIAVQQGWTPEEKRVWYTRFKGGPHSGERYGTLWQKDPKAFDGLEGKHWDRVKGHLRSAAANLAGRHHGTRARSRAGGTIMRWGSLYDRTQHHEVHEATDEEKAQWMKEMEEKLAG